MKLITGPYDYRADASERRASFTLRLIDSFWKSLKGNPLKLLRPHYYDMNRALQDAVNENVQVLGASYTVSLNLKDRVHTDHVKEQLSYMIASELLKCDRLPIRERENAITGDTEYTLEVPIFVLKAET